MEDCIFCKIIRKEISADIVYEDDNQIAFKDINPKAPVHLLIIPKKHISSVNDLEKGDVEVVGNLLFAAKSVAEKVGLKDKGYKLSINVGKGGGQEVFHIHIHLLGKL